MSKYISSARLKTAIIRLCDWKGQVQSQTVNHIFPFLALVERGVNAVSFTRFEESDDFNFYDKYFKVRAGDEPYFDPLNRRFRIGTHPHSNVATARKNTFENRWEAATSELRGDETYWRLNPRAAEIIADRAMTRSGTTKRGNVLDFAVWLFRLKEFPDSASSDDLLELFRTTFPMSAADFDQLFEYVAEPASELFAPDKLAEADVAAITEELDLEHAKAIKSLTSKPPPTSGEPPKSVLSEDDPILDEVQALLSLGSSGIILRGPPGTSKSWYAWNLALALTQNNSERIFRIQFHPSYGYEDFVEGYLPDEAAKSGFVVADRVFLRAVDAAKAADGLVVFIIDEINRGDTSRIFGELLTYIEQGWRDVEFTVKLSGKVASVPKNLVVLATMNPHDRSITQLDMALLRRFDHIDIAPSKERASEFLLAAGMKLTEAELVCRWFGQLQSILPFGIGHAYFLNVGDVGRLGLVWRYRILPFCESILEFEQSRLDAVKASFSELDRRLRGASGTE